MSSHAAQAPLQAHVSISGVAVHSSPEADWGNTGSTYEPEGCRNPPAMLHAHPQHGSGVCTALPASACLRASAAGAPTCATHSSWRPSGWEGERQCGGSSARRLNVCVLSLAQALVDWFSSAEYGELQLVQEAYKGITN